MGDMCLAFAKSAAQVVGVSYTEATRLYPRGCDAKTVYVSDWEQSPRAHCVHCARAEALCKYGTERKLYHQKDKKTGQCLSTCPKCGKEYR